MAETPSRTPAPSVSNLDSAHYWCYHCNKRVSVETLANLPDVICCECKNGFVESIQSIPATSPAPPSLTPDRTDDPSFGSQFLQVLRLIAQAAREEDAPPPPPPEDVQSVDDFFRIELNGWDNDEEEEEEEEEDDDDEEEDANDNNEESRENREENGGEEPAEEEEEEEEDNRSDNENGNEDNRYDEEGYDDEEDLRRRRRDLRLRFRDFTRSGRNRILDWAEILMGLEDNSIEFRLEVPEWDRYIGNPEDYVDAAGYEALLQNLAESDGGRRGAPPASKSAVWALPTVEIASEAETLVCAICKDMVNVGETAKKLPCGHGYHGDCILPWLGTRNSCPVCRFELPTDDPEYEEERKKRATQSVGDASTSGEENLGSG